MCTCIQKEKMKSARIGFYDYVFLCKKSNGRNRVITLTAMANDDGRAKNEAEDKCAEEVEGESLEQDQHSSQE
jgi:hypothetical protein